MRRTVAILYLTLCVAIGSALATGETSTMQAWVNSINAWVTSAKASIASLSTSLGSLTTRVAATEAMNSTQNTRLTTDEAAIATQAGQIATLQAQVTALMGVPTPISIPTPIADPQIQWRAGMETGDVSEWSEEVNSGTADSTVVQAENGASPHGGIYMLKQAVTGASGGTRMQRYPEVDALARAGTAFWWSWWDYYPTPISFGPFDTFIIWGVNSVKSEALRFLADPVWGLVFSPANNTLDLVFSPNGKFGPAVRYNSNVPVPVGKWNKFEAMVLPRGDASGAIKIILNNTVLFDLTGVQTQYPFVDQISLLAIIEQTGYGSNLTPTPCIHYVDDVTLSLSRVP